MKITRFFQEQISTTRAEFRSYPKRRFFFLGLIALVCFFVLIFIWNYVSKSAAIPLDFYFRNLVASRQTKFLDNLFSAVTFFGSNAFVVGFSFIISIVLIRSRHRKALAAILIALLGSEALVLILKLISGRVRPGGCINGDDCLSFPSGHTTLAVYFYGVIAFLIFRFVRMKMKLKVALSILLGAFVLLIGFSRIYLNYHFFTDILGGILLGCFWLIVVGAMIDFFYQK